MKMQVIHYRVLDWRKEVVRRKSHKIGFYANQEIDKIFGDRSVVFPRGGKTIVEFWKDGIKIASGTYKFNENNFNKKLGFKKAMNHAVDEIVENEKKLIIKNENS